MRNATLHQEHLYPRSTLDSFAYAVDDDIKTEHCGNGLITNAADIVI